MQVKNFKLYGLAVKGLQFFIVKYFLKIMVYQFIKLIRLLDDNLQINTNEKRGKWFPIKLDHYNLPILFKDLYAMKFKISYLLVTI